jgi:1-acyl-sn-glycerol-3-phosphate acyltransferase
MTYWIFKSTVLLALRLWFRPKVEGMRNLPDGPAIIASNHLSFSDSFFLGAIVSRRLTFLAKSSYFTTPGLKGRLMARLFRGLGQLAVDRDGGSSTGTALQAAVQVLRQGGLLGIYPEGTRSPDGRLYRGRMGVARIALAAGVPVVPVAMIGTERIQPPGAIVPKMAPLTIRIGAALDFSHYRGAERDRAALRSVTDEIMSELRRLSGQEYVDTYSPGPHRRGNPGPDQSG